MPLPTPHKLATAKHFASKPANAQTLYPAILLTGLLLQGILTQYAFADQRAVQPTPDRLSDHDRAALSRLVNSLAQQHMPTSFTDTRKWGAQKERWDGLHIQLDRGQLKTKRRKKLVNHGSWYKYQVSMPNPKNALAINILRVQQRPDGELEVAISVDAQIELSGRYARWNYGVQLLNVGIEAQATVRMNLVARIHTSLDFQHLPPDVVIQPNVQQTEIQLIDFELDRLGKLGSDVAEPLGDLAQNELRSRLAEKQADTTAKLNRALAKRQDDLRLSLHDYLQTELGRISPSRDKAKSQTAAPSTANASTPSDFAAALPAPSNTAAVSSSN